jgi:hypothetical protein
MTNVNTLFANAAALAINADEAAKAAKANSAGAIDMTVAALMTGKTLATKFVFDVKARDGSIVEHCRNVVIADYAAGFKNEDGTEYRAKVTAFADAILGKWFLKTGTFTDEQRNAVFMMVKRAIKIALGLKAQGMSAKLVDNKLVVSGGKGKEAAAISAAAKKSTSALMAAIKPAAKKGTNKTTQNTAANNNAIDLDGALRTVAHYASLVKNGKEAPSNTRLSFLKAIAEAASVAIAAVSEAGDD